MLGSMRQEDRPVRKGSQIDSHFQNRVNRSKNRYRSILQGESEPETVEDFEDEVYQVLSDFEDVASTHSSPIYPPAAVRQARQRRMSGSSLPTMTENSKFEQQEKEQANKVRVIRANRLRNSFKASSDEEDASDFLQKRRLVQLEQDRLSRQRKLELEQHAARLKVQEARQRRMLNEERRQLEKERQMLQDSKRKAANDLQRRKQLFKQEEVPSLEGSDCSENSVSLAPPPRSKSQSKTSKNADKDFLGEMSFFEDVRGALRDSGMMKLFVSSCVTPCFGDEGDAHAKKSSSSKSKRRRKP